MTSYAQLLSEKSPHHRTNNMQTRGFDWIQRIVIIEGPLHPTDGKDEFERGMIKPPTNEGLLTSHLKDLRDIGADSCTGRETDYAHKRPLASAS